MHRTARSWSAVKVGLALALVVAALPASVPAQAGTTDTIEVGAFDRGGYGRFLHKDGTTSYVHEPEIAFFTAGRDEYSGDTDPVVGVARNFFVFDIPATDATVTKAQLRFKFNASAYGSADSSETFALYDVTSNIDALLAGGDDTPGLSAIWSDLGSGHTYASRSFTEADQGKTITMTLDGTFRGLAQAGGRIAIGGALTTLSSKADWMEQLFLYSGTDFVTLVLTVAGSQPDGWLKSGAGAGVGYGITNSTGAGQSLTRSAAAGKTITFTVTIFNVVGLTDRYRILAAGSAKGFKVRYLWKGVDITSAVVGGTYRTPEIEMATSADLTIKISPTTKAAVGSSLARPITIRSVGDKRADAVKPIAKRR
jgi:hypothetical protein